MPAPLLIPALKWGIPAAAGFFGSLFGGGKDKNDDAAASPDFNDKRLNQLLSGMETTSAATRAGGEDLANLGTDTIRPVLDYFAKLTGGDPQALLEATQPQRARVIDQYDTALQAISEFSPRGGGGANASANARFSQANVLSSITADARSNAAEAAGALGTGVTGLGLNMQQLASSDLNSVIQAVLARRGLNLQQRGQNMDALNGAGNTLGTLLGLYLTRGSGKPSTAGGGA